MSGTKDWLKICADCHNGKQPKDCEYYGEPRGCNAPTYGGPPPTYYAELLSENARLRAACGTCGAKREVAELKSKMNDVVCENEALRDACGTCGAKREVDELRECLREAVTEVCNRLEKCGFKEPCVFKTCYVQKWRKALQDEGGVK